MNPNKKNFLILGAVVILIFAIVGTCMSKSKKRIEEQQQADEEKQRLADKNKIQTQKEESKYSGHTSEECKSECVETCNKKAEAWMNKQIRKDCDRLNPNDPKYRMCIQRYAKMRRNILNFCDDLKKD